MPATSGDFFYSLTHERHAGIERTTHTFGGHPQSEEQLAAVQRPSKTSVGSSGIGDISDIFVAFMDDDEFAGGTCFFNWRIRHQAGPRRKDTVSD